MENDQLFGPAAQQKRILALLRKEAARWGAVKTGDLIPEAQMTGNTKDHILKVFKQMGAPPILLGVIGSWGDTLKADAIEELLEKGYGMKESFASLG